MDKTVQMFFFIAIPPKFDYGFLFDDHKMCPHTFFEYIIIYIFSFVNIILAILFINKII